MCLFLTSILFSAPTSDMIVVDQIGYRPASAKWFMIKNPITGYDSAITYIPGATVQLRRSSDNAVMQTITLSDWNGGATDTTFSGDRVWQGNFTSFTTTGTYHIYDPANDRQSYDFEIGNNIYNGALAASLKSYYYNRSNIAKTAPYAEGVWTHALGHTQQLTALLYDASLGGIQAGTERDITKGWFDAGDYRKYTSWMAPVIWDLAYAYEWYPDRFSDASNIPESGNGVPDILDEIKWEIDWMLNMQETNAAAPGFGALYSGAFVVNGINGTGNGIGDPSTEDRPYFYANYSTAATASGAAAFAIGARLFAAYESAYPGYSAALLIAAERAWAFLQANPGNIQYNHTNFQNAEANQGASGDNQLRFMAAAELYRATGIIEYRNYCDTNYNNANTTDGTHQPINNNYFETGASTTMQRGLVSYCMAPGATASVVNTIKTAVRNGIEWNVTARINNCPYKAHMWPGHYTWGSNAMKANWGNLVQYGIELSVNPANDALYREVAEEYLHYYHGRNATAFCYLTQSQLFGADKSITEIYHGWFHHGTPLDANPAPGFLAGGPNQFFSPDASYGGTIEPPQNQPPMKAYRDWNTSWPQNSWEVTENSTGYQSRHILLNAAFAGPAGPAPTNTPTLTHTPFAGTPTLTYTRTPTPSVTMTSTLTPIPCDVIIYDGETASTNLAAGGSWIWPDGSVSEVTTTANSPTRSMRINFVWAADWYCGFGFNWANWGTSSPRILDASQAVSLDFWIRSDTGTETSITIQLSDSADLSSNSVNLTSYLPSGATTTWQKVSVPMSVFTGIDKTALWEFRLAFGGSISGDKVIYIDDISFGLPCGPAQTPTNTPTITNTAVISPTFTGTPTPTTTGTYTRTATSTATLTSTPLNTASPTPSSTATNTNTLVVSATFTPTHTHTATPTSTFTFTGTPTGTATSSFTATTTPTYTITETHTVSPTETEYAGTPTDTYTPTVTNTAEDTATATPTNTATPADTYTSTATVTVTSSNTTVSTATNTPTLTNTVENPTFTMTATMTWTQQNTATFTATPTATLTSTPSATRTSTPTRTRTPTVTRTATPGATATATTVPDAVKLAVSYAQSAPNPVISPQAGQAIRVDFRVSQACETVYLHMYTSAFRRVASVSLAQMCTAGFHSRDAAVPGIEKIAAGVYYGVVEAKNSRGDKEKSRPFVILIIK